MRWLYCSKHYLHLNVQRFAFIQFFRHKWHKQNEYSTNGHDICMQCFKNKPIKHLRWRLLIHQLIIHTVLSVQILVHRLIIFLQFHITSICEHLYCSAQLRFSVNHGLTCTTHTEILDNTKLIMSHYNKPLCVLSPHSQIHRWHQQLLKVTMAMVSIQLEHKLVSCDGGWRCSADGERV